VTGEQFASMLLAESYFVATGVDELTTYGDIVRHLGGEQRASFKIQERAGMDQKNLKARTAQLQHTAAATSSILYLQLLVVGG